MDRDEVIRRAAEYLRKPSVDGPNFPEMILADFLIEQSQAHGWLDLQMVFLAEAMEREREQRFN